MFVDKKRYKRTELTADQWEFLQRLMPFGRLIQKMSLEKCEMSRIVSPNGMCASIIMADIVAKSAWGTHPVAAKDNNLSLLLKSDNWRGKTVTYTDAAGVCSYRSYLSWLDYSIDLTDEMTFFNRRDWEHILNSPNRDIQVDRFGFNNSISKNTLEGIMDKYGMWEFDI
jgi:uncharacterized FlgJ-related protein